MVVAPVFPYAAGMERWLVSMVWMAVGAAACGPSPGGGDDAPASTGSSTGAVGTSGTSASDGVAGTTAGDVDTTSSGPADSTGTGDVPVASCNPVDVHGPYLESHVDSDWVAFEGCDEDSVYIERPGTEPIDTIDGFDKLGGFEIALLGVPGVASVGRGLCCSGSAACIVVSINRWSWSLPEMFDTIATTFGELGDVCFGLRVDLVGEEGPRCEPEDPECLPLPVCGDDPSFACCQAPAFDPDATRTPVGDDLSTGSCTHDGECLIFHTVCGDYMTPSGGGVDQCTDEISEAYCGCVDGACHWYEQG